MRPVVDLPQPDSPTRPSVSPALTSKETPQTAWTSPTLWRTNFPPRTGKCFTRFSTWRSGAPSPEGQATTVWPTLGCGQFAITSIGYNGIGELRRPRRLPGTRGSSRPITTLSAKWHADMWVDPPGRAVRNRTECRLFGVADRLA